MAWIQEAAEAARKRIRELEEKIQNCQADIEKWKAFLSSLHDLSPEENGTPIRQPNGNSTVVEHLAYILATSDRPLMPEEIVDRMAVSGKVVKRATVSSTLSVNQHGQGWERVARGWRLKKTNPRE